MHDESILENELYIARNGSSVCHMNGKPKSYRDLGFTDEEFLEIVDFFQELMRLDQKGKLKKQLVQVLFGRLQQLVSDRRKILLDELSGLENL